MMDDDFGQFWDSIHGTNSIIHVIAQISSFVLHYNWWLLLLCQILVIKIIPKSWDANAYHIYDTNLQIYDTIKRVHVCMKNKSNRKIDRRTSLTHKKNLFFFSWEKKKKKSPMKSSCSSMFNVMHIKIVVVNINLYGCIYFKISILSVWLSLFLIRKKKDIFTFKHITND